jgi:Ser/Thr protein kinase RdoA (MazF antagonist)
MHDQGLHHRDLNAGNLLLRPQGDGFAVTIIDLDRARLMASVPAGRRRAALARLARSLAKERDGRILDAAERAALVDAYGAA